MKMSKELLNALKIEMDCECNIDDFIFADSVIINKYRENTCICGTPIKYQYTIKHKNSNEYIGPIGSECIKYFEGYEEYNTFLKLDKKIIAGGKLKGYPFNEMTEVSLKWWYYKCKSTKKYALDLKQYYKFKYIDKLHLPLYCGS